jgi:hypothetical protein
MQTLEREQKIRRCGSAGGRNILVPNIMIQTVYDSYHSLYLTILLIFCLYIGPLDDLTFRSRHKSLVVMVCRYNAVDKSIRALRIEILG